MQLGSRDEEGVAIGQKSSQVSLRSYQEDHELKLEGLGTSTFLSWDACRRCSSSDEYLG